MSGDVSSISRALLLLTKPLKIDPSSLAPSQTVQRKGSLGINGVTNAVTAPVTFALSALCRQAT